jgi:hypothetical protein
MTIERDWLNLGAFEPWRSSDEQTAEIARLRAEAFAMLGKLKSPRAKAKRGAPPKAEVGLKYWNKLAAKGKISTAVNLGTGVVDTCPRVHGAAPTPRPNPPEPAGVAVAGDDLNIREGK